MHRMGDAETTKTKLFEFDDFKSSILQRKAVFESLVGHRLEFLSLERIKNSHNVLYPNLDKFQYTYGSGNFNIILKPVRQNKDLHRSLI